jgi:PA14 domain
VSVVITYVGYRSSRERVHAAFEEDNLVKPAIRSILLWMGLFVAGCSGENASGPDETLGENKELLAGNNAKGALPAGLPARVMVGLFEDTGATWMKSSGVRWDTRYRYLTKGWVNNWGYGTSDGSFALGYFRECDVQGFVPAVQYYQIFGEPGGGEAATLQKLQNTATMRAYFGDFKLLMQRTKDFGKPALILLEADAFGFLQQQAGSNANATAAIASTGMPELAGLPNTVAGFGLAFLQLRKAVGATNAVLGVHISAWASGKDIAASSVTDALGPEVDKVHAFLAPLGLGANVTGQTFDVLVGDPLDRDADFYRLTRGEDRWWDASDTASINSRSFNRYAEWLRLWNVKAQRRWVLWQIPLGNSSSKNVYSSGGPGEGYKDNRPEYFFGSGTAHIEKFAESGVIALLFGAGAGGQSSFQNDHYSDGQLFMKSRAGAMLNAGGVPLSTGSTPACSAVAGTGGGLSAEYFSGTTLSTRVLSRTDANVDFSWGTAAPAAAVPADNFSVRWTGRVSPRYSGAYTFYTSSDDGVRLWVNGQKLVDNWTNHGVTENSGVISLVAGQKYDLKLEYYDATGGATARLSWSSSCEPKAAVPTSQLYPAAPTGGDAATYNFETSAQSWVSTGAGVTAVARSTERPFAGTGSLKVTLGTTGDGYVKVANPSVPPGATVTFQVWVPAGAQLSAVQPYVLQGASGGWAWTGSWRAASSLQAGSFNALTVTVPANAATLAELGVVFALSGSAAGAAAYVDSVTY